MLAAGIVAPIAALSYEYATVERWDGSPDRAQQGEHGRHRRHEHRDREHDKGTSTSTVAEADATPAAPVEFAVAFAPRVSVADVPGAPVSPETPSAPSSGAIATAIPTAPPQGLAVPTQPPTTSPVGVPPAAPPIAFHATAEPSPVATSSAPAVVSTGPAIGGAYSWDGCTISWPSYTTDNYGAAASSDSSSVMQHLAARFSAYGYRDGFSVGNTVYVNDVPANQGAVLMGSNHGHTFPAPWYWPVPASPTVEGGFSGDSQMLIVQHTNPCAFWESTSTAPTGSGYSAWTAGVYPAIVAAGNEAFVNPPGTDPDGAGPTWQSNLIPDLKFEEVQAGQVSHTLELVLPPCSPAGASYVYPAARAEGISCASDQGSMPYGATWQMLPNPPSGCDRNADPQSAAIIYALKHYGARLLNTTGSTTNPVFYAANAIGVRYPATSPYSASSLGSCHLLTDGFILSHAAISSN